MPGRIDLHTHTTASDGTDTPRQLVERAKAVGLRAVAVTDHDTIDGLAEAVATGAEIDLDVVPGVELSTDFRGKTIHLLGYFFDQANEALAGKLAWARGQRVSRNERLVARFGELGVDMTLAEVEAVAGGDVVGRPHFAEVLVRKRVVATHDEAFTEWLRTDAKAYLPKVRLDAPTAVGLIRGAGGLPVFAHPMLTRWTPLEIDSAVEELASLGLAGIEALYTHHNPSQALVLKDIAARYGLLITGGSDYHGAVKPHIRLGYGVGDLSVPATLLEKMRAAQGGGA